MTMTLAEALALADHASPLPHLAGEALRVLRAELERRPTVPPGWKLVPVEPTREMLEKTSWPGCAATDYKHMLAAAPELPEARGVVDEAMVKRFLEAFRNTSGDEAIDADEKVARRWLTAALAQEDRND